MAQDTIYAQIAHQAITESSQFTSAIEDILQETGGKVSKFKIREVVAAYISALGTPTDPDDKKALETAGAYVHKMVQTGHYRDIAGFLVQVDSPAYHELLKKVRIQMPEMANEA
jgi:hypothetical protein